MALKSLISKTWQHASSIIFIGGFAMDSFLLPDFDDPITKYLGLSYLTVLAIILYLREWVISKNTATPIEQKLYSILTFGVSFFSGSALSFVFVYAMRSAAFVVSWPFFVLLLVIMAANEFISTHAYRFTLDIAVYFTAIIFYAIYHVPILFGRVNDVVFLGSVLISAVAGLIYISVLRHASETAEHEQGRGFALAVGVPLFVGMLYLLNIIPAVPLTLTSSGVYHSVVKNTQGEYIGIGEQDTRFLAKYRTPIIHIQQGGGVYYFSSVSAPAELSAPLTQVWEQYDSTSHAWIESTTIPFTLSGGRKDGYRAYSKKESLKPGLWRVTVKVDNNRIVGRLRFYVEQGQTGNLVESKL